MPIKIRYGESEPKKVAVKVTRAFWQHYLV